AGSTGLDLATSVTKQVTLLDSSVNLILTGIFGPPGPQTNTLLVGRSSTTLLRLFALPGVIDSDSVGEIKIMVWTPFPPCTVPQSIRIAQLILFPQNSSPPSTECDTRVGGFGSTGTPQILWVQEISDQRPTYKGQQVKLTGILDTGADVSISS
ncbi:POK9 protein, partial [Hirundo rustica]|nr:POK9 protein [Hirundo rustica]